MSVVPMIATHHRDRIEREAAVENHSPDKHTPSIVGNDGEREHAYRDRGSAASDNRDVAFGPFRLFPSQQLLQEGDKAVRLGSRALDILIALVERAGELVSKNDLVAHVWPDTFVEEANLRVHIFALRRALRDGQRGQRYVVNVPGRGYRFVAPIIVSEGSLPSHSRPAAGPVRAYPPRPAASQSKQPAIGSENPSIAVLAFDNMSGDPAQEYFSDGITEDITTELSRFRDLMVIARNSSFTFKGKAVEAKEVGRKLGACFIVEGSVRRAGNRVRVTAQLIEASSGNHLWAERYDRNIEDIFAVQDEVVSTIVATLIGRLAVSGAEQSRRKPPQLWEAHDYFLQGRERAIRFDAEAAAPLLRRAIELDPCYAQVHGWLAGVMYILYSAHGRREDLEEALREARRALELDPLDSSSHRALGLVYSQMRQYDLAGMHFDRGVALNPNDVYTSILRGLWLAFVGRGEEALDSLDADLRRDPFPPTWYWGCRGAAFVQLRRHAEAVEAFQHMDLLHWWMHCYIAACQAHLGKIDLARRAASELLRVKPHFSMVDFERSEWWRDPADLEHIRDGMRKAGLVA